jgi:alpha-L-fucosidase
MKWENRLGNPGVFRVSVEYDADKESSANIYKVQVGGKTFERNVIPGVVSKKEFLGEVALEKGVNNITVSAVKIESKELFNLRAVVLSPVVDIKYGSPPRPLEPVPSADQLAWHEEDLTLFIHFGVNTFTGLGTGLGDENPDIFNPLRLNCRQWVRAAKDAGFKGMILTAKHHDGFCLWPTSTTEHSVKSSSWRGGKGDVVRELADACRREGIKLGIYCSPWDRSQKNYNTDKKEYTEFYRRQLTELLSNYGDIYEMWFDGNRAMIEDWSSVIRVVRELQPHVIIKQGPRVQPITEDVRWVGNELALAPLENWAVYPPPSGEEDRERVWFPVECDPKTMSKWFWVDEEPTPLAEMLDNYYTSVGRGSILLFNVPPTPDGLFSDAWVLRLKEFRAALDSIFSVNIAVGADVAASNVRANSSVYGADAALDDDPLTYWATDDGICSAALTVEWDKEVEFNVIRMEEMIALGQRVSKYKVEIWNSSHDRWDVVSRQTTIGRRKLDRIPKVKTSKVRLTILEARACPTIRIFGVYLDSVSPKNYFKPEFANRECDPKHRHRR